MIFSVECFRLAAINNQRIRIFRWWKCGKQILKNYIFSWWKITILFINAIENIRLQWATWEPTSVFCFSFIKREKNGEKKISRLKAEMYRFVCKGSLNKSLMVFNAHKVHLYPLWFYGFFFLVSLSFFFFVYCIWQWHIQFIRSIVSHFVVG